MKDVNAALAVRELTAASANHLVLDANEHLDRVERDWTTDVHLTQPGLDIYDHFNNLHCTPLIMLLYDGTFCT